MAFDDYRINAQVRALLVRRGIDLQKVEFGTTNGIIYLRGELRTYFNAPLDDMSQMRQDEIVLVHKLEQALRRFPGVRDVVFHLARVVKVGSRWKPR